MKRKLLLFTVASLGLASLSGSAVVPSSIQHAIAQEKTGQVLPPEEAEAIGRNHRRARSPS